MAKDSRKHRQRETPFGGAIIGAELGSSEASASDALREGMALFLKKATGSNVDPGKFKGNLFEYIEAAKYNADAARKSIPYRYNVTDAMGRSKDAADLELVDVAKGKLIERAQMKAGSPEYDAWALSDPKYKGMQKIVPSDHVDEVRDIAKDSRSNPNPKDPRDYGDTENRVQGRLEYGGASSGGTSSQELDGATTNPERYANRRLLDQFGREVAGTGIKAAGAGAVMGGAFSTVVNCFAYSKGKIDGKQAVENIAEDTVKTGVRSGATGMLGVVIRQGASRAGLKGLARSNVATVVAAGLIETGVTVYRYATGEISGQEAGERIGGTACGTVSSVGMSAAAGAIFGPVGIVVGGIAGYLLSTHVYHSCIAVFRNARLAEEAAQRVKALSRQAVEAMSQQRRQFENRLAAYLGRRQEIFDRCFDEVDHAVLTNQPAAAVQALGDLVSACGQKPQFADFQEFDRFMTESKRPLVI